MDVGDGGDRGARQDARVIVVPLSGVHIREGLRLGSLLWDTLG